MHCQQACQPRQGRRPYGRFFLMHFQASWLLMSVTNALKRTFRKRFMNKSKICIEKCHKHAFTQRHTHTHIYIYMCVCVNVLLVFVYIHILIVRNRTIPIDISHVSSAGFSYRIDRLKPRASRFRGPPAKVYISFNAVIWLPYLCCHNVLYFINNSSVILHSFTPFQNIAEF